MIERERGAGRPAEGDDVRAGFVTGSDAVGVSSQDGVVETAARADAEHERHMTAARVVMRDHRNVLQVLAR